MTIYLSGEGNTPNYIVSITAREKVTVYHFHRIQSEPQLMTTPTPPPESRVSQIVFQKVLSIASDRHSPLPDRFSSTPESPPTLTLRQELSSPQAVAQAVFHKDLESHTQKERYVTPQELHWAEPSIRAPGSVVSKLVKQGDEESKRHAVKENDAPIQKNQSCTDCETTDTPLWRNGPAGDKTLCNACGLNFKRKSGKYRRGAS